MKLVILGSNGQIGWELERVLRPLGQLLSLGRTDADLADAGALRAALLAAKPDIIINAAAHTAVDRAEAQPELADRLNHRAVGEIGEIAASLGASVIHYSTDYVFDGNKPGAYLETDLAAPLNVYGHSKLRGEQALVASGAQHLIFRTSWVHSPRRDNFIRTLLRLAAERDNLRVVADQIGAPTSAARIAAVTASAVAAIASGKPPAPGLYHLAASGSTSWHGLAMFAIAEAIDAGLPLRTTPATIVPISTAEYGAPARRPANSLLDTSKLCTAFDVSLPDWRVDVRQTVREVVEQALR